MLRAALGVIALATPAVSLGAVRLVLDQAPGGMAISGTHPNYQAGFGNVNGLGVGTPGPGIAVITSGVSGGVLYTTPYNFNVSGVPTNAIVYAALSPNFAHPASLVLESCYPASGCGSAANYTTLSTNVFAPTQITPNPGVSNGRYTAYLGLFVANTNGAGAFNGTDTATVVFVLFDPNTFGFDFIALALNAPGENLQTAVQLVLSTAPGGLTVSPAADFSANFGNTNGLGLGTPSPGLTIVPSAGGAIYATPYLLAPSFSSFTSTTGTVNVYVSTDFAHPSTLQLQDAAASGGPYSSISKSSVSPTLVTNAAASGSTLTRYLGLLVSFTNGAGAFPGTAGASGADNAVLTYVLAVP